MNVALRKPISQGACFVWAETQEEPYEFDGLRPVPMTRRDLDHSRIIRNFSRHLATVLAGTAYESSGPEAGVSTVVRSIRYPDVVGLVEGDVLRLAEIGVELPVAVIYEDVVFDEARIAPI